MKFSEMGLKKEIVDALNDIGLTETFPIQESTMPLILSGEDVIGQAHTGSGKTFAFSLPMMNNIDTSIRGTVALILVPTRELATQVREEIAKVSKYIGVKSIAIYGGASLRMQYDALKWEQHIIVATPGRLIDMINREGVSLSKIKYLVLDEADMMLDMGFIEDIEFILSKIPKARQTMLFSATMPKEVLRISERYMKKPVKVLLDQDEMSVELINQTYLIVNEDKKFKYLAEILKTISGKTLIFCATKRRTIALSRELYINGFRTVEIHGDLEQNRREEAIARFKAGKPEILVATDVASRGIDIPKVEHVINYDVPMNPLVYFHRIGRTARAGNSGNALTLVSQHNYDDFQNILKHTEVFIKQLNEQMGVKVEVRENVRRDRPKSFGRRNFSRGHSGGRRYFRR